MMARVIDFAKGAAWAIVPERFEALAAVAREASGAEKLAETIVTAGAGLDERKLYSVSDEGIATIEINGPLAKNLDWWDRRVLGMVDYLDVQAAVRETLNDDQVVGIVLAIDSPGGTVNGVDETASAVFDARGRKPIVAFSSGMVASAAYRIASAADRMIIGKTAEAGSIGVLMIHTDWSRLEERIGIKTTYLTAGKYKAIGNPSEPLSETARGEFQGFLDQLYTEFVETVALYRDVENGKALAMADGRIFIGERAVAVGLADEIGTIQTALALAGAGAENQTSRIGRSFVMEKNKMEIKTYDDLKAVGGDVLKQAEDKAFTLGAESVDLKASEQKGAEAERARVMGIASAYMGEEEGAKLEKIVASGITVEQYKAIAGERKVEADPKKKEMLEAIQKAGAENPGAGGADKGQKSYFQLVEDVRVEKKCSRFEAMKEVNRRHPEARAQMLREANPHLAAAK